MDPHAVLGVGKEATGEEIRSAWLAAVREHPPDRDPDAFQRLREAYDLLKDPFRRSAERLFGHSEFETFSDLARALAGKKRWLGPEPWLRLVRQGSS